MLNNVMPQRGTFFELLGAHTDRVVAGANATMRLVSGLGNPHADNAALIEEVNANESSADRIKSDSESQRAGRGCPTPGVDRLFDSCGFVGP